MYMLAVLHIVHVTVPGKLTTLVYFPISRFWYQLEALPLPHIVMGGLLQLGVISQCFHILRPFTSSTSVIHVQVDTMAAEWKLIGIQDFRVRTPCISLWTAPTKDRKEC